MHFSAFGFFFLPFRQDLKIHTHTRMDMQTLMIKMDVLEQNGIDKWVLGCLLWQNALLILFNMAIQASPIYM